MKIKDRMIKELFARGLFKNQAEAVLKQYVESDLGEAMRDRMDDDESDYPDCVTSIVWLGVKLSAMEWIDATCPEHWARPLFMNVSADSSQTLSENEIQSTSVENLVVITLEKGFSQGCKTCMRVLVEEKNIFLGITHPRALVCSTVTPVCCRERKLVFESFNTVSEAELMISSIAGQQRKIAYGNLPDVVDGVLLL
jgi:hypothetical protein